MEIHLEQGNLTIFSNSYIIVHHLLYVTKFNEYNLLNVGSAFLATRVYKDTVKIRIMVTRVSTPLAGLYSPLFV